MIRFYCSCGKRLKVRASEIGRTVECPHCASQLVVPNPDAPPADVPATSATEALAAAMRELGPAATARPSKLPAKKKPPAPGRKPTKPGARPAPGPSAANKPVIIGVAAAFAIAAILLILSFIAGDGNSPEKKPAAPEVKAPPTPQTPSKPERNLHPAGDLFPKVAPSN